MSKKNNIGKLDLLALAATGRLRTSLYEEAKFFIVVPADRILPPVSGSFLAYLVAADGELHEYHTETGSLRPCSININETAALEDGDFTRMSKHFPDIRRYWLQGITPTENYLMGASA